MNILFCVPEKITTRLGAPKVYVELAKALEREGQQCTLVGINEVAPGIGQYDRKIDRNEYYAQCLKTYIHENAAAYDVIEYEHQFLPFSREELPADVLLVARSVLLVHNAHHTSLPTLQGIPLLLRNLFNDLTAGNLFGERGPALSEYLRVLKKHIGTAWHYASTADDRKAYATMATETCNAADLVMISNQPDRDTLRKHGVNSDKVKVLPYGMSPERYDSFAEAASTTPETKTVVFVGTFDFRKGGATDLPRIVRRIHREAPGTNFLLLGTKGLFVSAEEVMPHFAPSVRDSVEVIPKYSPASLPKLLARGSMGLFPSRFEGFPFSVLEMSSAGLPVFSYNAPGPPEMLGNDYLVPLGDWKKMAEKAVALLNDEARLARASNHVRQSVQRFNWDSIAAQTIDVYGEYR